MLRKFILIMLLTSHSFAHADLAAICSTLLGGAGETAPELKVRELLNRTTTDGIYLRLKAQVAAIFEDRQLTLEEKSAKAFAAYLDLRLGLLPETQQQSVRNLLSKQFFYRIHHRPDLATEVLRCSFDRRQNAIEMTVPVSIAHTVLDYMIRVHEVEHVIQSLNVSLAPYGIYNPKYYPVFVFNLERGAMTAEALFIRSIPKGHLDDLEQKILSGMGMPQEEKKFILGLVSDARSSESIEMYLKLQWSRGRYSRLILAGKQLKETWPLLAVPIGLFWYAMDSLKP